MSDSRFTARREWRSSEPEVGQAVRCGSALRPNEGSTKISRPLGALLKLLGPKWTMFPDIGTAVSSPQTGWQTPFSDLDLSYRLLVAEI